MSQQTAIQKMRKKSCCQQTCYFCRISQSKTDHKSMKHSKINVQNKSLQKRTFLTRVQIHKICLSRMTQFFLNIPSVLKTTCCSTDVYRGRPKQPDKPERSKGVSPVSATVSKNHKKERSSASALHMEKCTAWGRRILPILQQLLVVTKKQQKTATITLYIDLMIWGFGSDYGL